MKELDYTLHGVMQPSSQPGFWTIIIITTCGFFAGYHTKNGGLSPPQTIACLCVSLSCLGALFLLLLLLLFYFADTIRLLATIIDNADTQHKPVFSLCLYNVKNKPKLEKKKKNIYIYIKQSRYRPEVAQRIPGS